MISYRVCTTKIQHNQLPHPKYGLNASKNNQTGTGTTDATPHTLTNEIADQFELKETKISLQFIIKFY